MPKLNIKELKLIAGNASWITPGELEAILDDLALQLQEEIVGQNKPNVVRCMPFIPGLHVISKILEKINDFFGTAYESDQRILMKHFNCPLKKN